MYKYSDTTKSFYPVDFLSNYSNLPTDLIDADESTFQNCVNRPQGATLSVVSGVVTVIPAPAPTIAEIVDSTKAAKIASLSKSCQDYIYAGFTSNALGSTYTYPANDKDQTNLAARVLSSLYPNLPASWTTSFLCCDTSGVWGYVSHTAAQIQQVGADANTYIASALVKNNTLAGQVNAIDNTSTTALTDVADIVW